MQQDEPATVIGESLLITGELSGKEDMTVLGRVEGSIRLDKTLFVAIDGIVKADVAVGNAVISGIVVGNVTASESVQITETGRLVGDLHAPRIVIVAGARVRGQVDMSQDGRASRETRASAVTQASQTRAAADEAALARSPSGRFQRLSLPQRRPMPAAPAPVRRASEPAKKERQQAHSDTSSASSSRQSTSSSPSRRSTAQSKRRSHGRRRD